MGSDKILDFLCQQRFNHTMDRILVYNKKYQKAEIEVSKKLNYLLKMKLSNKQRKAIDRVIDAQNHSTSEYGRIVYQQGLRDGIKLMHEVNDLLYNSKKIE